MIQRMLHIICDKCGAEGPMRIGEQRPSLLREVFSLGWKIVNGAHFCMECVNPQLSGPITFGDGAVVEDRSVHWTEARKKESSQ